MAVARCHSRSAWASSLALVIVLAASPGMRAQQVPPSQFAALHWRLLGPYRGGWATAVAGVPGSSTTFYFGSADGGVWRSTDAGVTWRPLFDRAGSASIGALAVAPSNTRVLWAGTGQVQQRWDIVDGDGVYRSSDGGETWTNVGLADTRHIGRIWIDPRNPDTVLVAALGHVFGSSDQRGIFRTEDGGRTWTKVLFRDADTGAVDIAGDSAVPDVLYASLWQVRRHPWLDYWQPTIGPGSGIYKSSDAGRHWAPVGASGLPTKPLGRISLGVAPGTSARRVWALITAPEGGGLYRSDDGGSTWTVINTDPGLGNDYMSEVIPDPRNAEIVWTVGRSLHRSQDGGRTFILAKGSPGGDDYHCLWIDPTDPQRMITGADQGAVITLNGGHSWSSWYNQPTGQFYRLAADTRFPFWVYSGQQDSGTVAIASRSDYGQITFRDWHPVGGDERDGDVPDPTNPDVVYGAGLGGRISKWFASTGQVQNVTPWPVSSYGERPGTTEYRYSWITPLAISPRPPHAIYTAAQVVFRSTDGGRSWTKISPDLTGDGRVASSNGCQGEVTVQMATPCGFGVIFAVAPSAAADGLVWVGTDNGHVHLTRNDGGSWVEVTPPGMRDWTKVNIIHADPTDPATAYVAADRHRLDDFQPLAWRTHDYGRTWTEIGHDLPNGAWVGVVRSDPQRKGLLFAGTSRGIFVSFDDGNRWQTLQLDLPRTGINDMVVQADAVVVATQGRGIWALDGLEPLRHATAGASMTSVLVAPGSTYRLRANNNKDTPLPPEEPRGENPPVGAIIDYLLPGDASSARPDGAGARSVVIEIAGSDGKVIRRFSSGDKPERPPADLYFADMWLAPPSVPSTRPGHNRFVWDLRYPAPRAVEYEYSIAAVPGGARATPEGAFVLPGKYEVRLTVDGKTERQPLTVMIDPRVKVPENDLAALLDFQRDVDAEMSRSANLAEAVKTARKPLEAARDAAKDADARATAERTLADFDRVANGRDNPASVNGVLASLARDLESADLPPTEPQRQLLAQYRDALNRFAAQWKSRAPR